MTGCARLRNGRAAGSSIRSILFREWVSVSFITPIGYQTNLMVMAPGGYRFGDYARVGVPASLIVMAIVVTVVYAAWM